MDNCEFCVRGELRESNSPIWWTIRAYENATGKNWFTGKDLSPKRECNERISVEWLLKDADCRAGFYKGDCNDASH